MDRALLIEEKNAVVQKTRTNPRDKGDWKDRALGWRQSMESSSSGTRNYVTRPVPLAIEGSDSKEGETKKNNGGRKSLSPEELRELSKKGLCFKCGEKWGHDHKCKLRHLQLELVEIEEVEGEESEEEKEEKEVIEMKVLQLSMKSKEGLTSNKSFKVWGLIGNRAVLILIDNGATTNFISCKLVEELNLPVIDTEEYTVTVGNGEKVHHKGVCKGLTLYMQGILVEQKFFLMTLGGTDIVLGMDWLASLGDIRANFKQLVIKWKQGDEEFMVRGEPSLCRQQVSAKTMMRDMQQEGEGFMVDYYLTDTALVQQQELPADQGGVLEAFQDVFQKPTSLPPVREQDHAITLQPGAPTPNI